MMFTPPTLNYTYEAVQKVATREKRKRNIERSTEEGPDTADDAPVRGPEERKRSANDRAPDRVLVPFREIKGKSLFKCCLKSYVFDSFWQT